ncbi:MAG: hypothetical protein LBF59_10195 [Prevotellaceae bacterium]|jgi:hypothetical protein|nr:hypothetical protein [Prevotellaceae bacterium]
MKTEILLTVFNAGRPYPLIFIMVFFLNIGLFSQTTESDYPYNVGDIAFDSTRDNPAFEVIDEKQVLPYNTKCGMMIEGERYRVVEYFSTNFKLKPIKGETGYIVIRFLVNHKGETDRYRMCEMDENTQLRTFDKSISDKIFDLTKKLSGWKPVVDKNSRLRDYYQYLVFKMKDGLIEYILP